MLSTDVASSVIGTIRASIGLYVLSIYELLLLLDDECRLVYKAPWNIIKVLYLLCRFSPIVSSPVIIATYLTGHNDDCSGWLHSHSASCLLLQIGPQCLLLLRTWIFSGRKKLLAWLFSISFSAYIAALSWGTALFMMSYSKQSGEACLNSLSAARHLIGDILLGSVVIDVVAAAVVIYYYISDKNIRGNLGKLCLLQAVTYVMIMVAINLSTWYSDFFTPTTAGLSYAMTLIVPNLLACRFILQLRKETNPTETQMIELVSIVVRDGLEDLQQR